MAYNPEDPNSKDPELAKRAIADYFQKWNQSPFTEETKNFSRFVALNPQYSTGEPLSGKSQYNLGSVREANEPANALYNQQALSAAGSATLARAQDYEGLGYQRQALGSLYNTMSGAGPSVAQQQLNRGLQSAQAAQAATAASARGGGANLAAAQRLGAEQQAALGAQANEQAAMVRAQEVLGAQGQYGNMANAVRQASQGSLGLEQQRELAYRQMAQQGDLAQLQSNAARDQARIDYAMRKAAIEAGLSEGQANRDQQMIGAGASAIGAGIGFVAGGPAGGAAGYKAGEIIGGRGTRNWSDRNLKTDIRDGSNVVESALDHLKPYTYRYKDDSMGEGVRPGIMAQDMEKSAMGKRAVVPTPIGKAVDVSRGLSLALAASANLHSRLRKLEEK